MATLLAIALAIGGLIAASSAAAPPTDTSPCPRAETRAALKSFVAAFNTGSSARLDALFAEEPEFQWYSSGNPGRRVGARAKDRRTLLTHFQRRRDLGDRMRLVSIDFNRSAPHWSNFGLQLERSVPDFEGGEWLELPGKGSTICEQEEARIIVLSLGNAQTD